MPRFFLSSLCLSLLLLTACSSGSKPAAGGEKKRGIIGRTWQSATKVIPFRGTPKPAIVSKASSATFRGLEMKMTAEPTAPKLGETRQLTVTLQLQNKGKRLVQLDFPTTQRIEVLVRNTAGKMVEQWSEDQRFENEPGLVAINPGERLEYAATVSTRDFVAGQEYIVEGFFPNYESLRGTVKITPVR